MHQVWTHHGISLMHIDGTTWGSFLVFIWVVCGFNALLETLDSPGYVVLCCVRLG